MKTLTDKKQITAFNRAVKENNVAFFHEKLELYALITNDKTILKHLIYSLNNEHLELFQTLMKAPFHYNINIDILPVLSQKQDLSYAQSYLDILKEAFLNEHFKHSPDSFHYVSLEDAQKQILTITDELLYYGVESNHLPLVEYCIERGARLYHPDWENNPLEHAALKNQKEIADLLISKGAPLDKNEHVYLFNTFLNKHFDLFFHFLNHYNSLDGQMIETLFSNPTYDHRDIRLTLKKNFHSIAERFLPYLHNEDTKTSLLTSAILYKSFSVAQLILENSIDLTFNNAICLKTAAENNNIKMVKLLMDYGANPALIMDYKSQFSLEMNTIFETYPRFNAMRDKLYQNLDNKQTLHQHKI